MRRWMQVKPAAVAFLAAGILGSSVFVPPASAAAGGVPWTDSSAQGLIGFCGRDDQPVTSGSLTDQPFVWKAVSTVAAPAHYTEAILELYQPIQHVDPSGWSGYQLTDTAAFNNPQHPAAQATNVDEPLIGADQQYPPYWDGLYQLRMYFAAPQEAVYTQPYPVAVIQVTGKKWQLVQGGTVDCSASQAVSGIAKDLPQSVLNTPQTVALGRTAGSRTNPAPATAASESSTASDPHTKTSTPSSSSTSPSPPDASGRASSALGPAGGSSQGGSGSWWMAIAGGVVVLGGAGAAVRWLRRRAS